MPFRISQRRSKAARAISIYRKLVCFRGAACRASRASERRVCECARLVHRMEDSVLLIIILILLIFGFGYGGYRVGPGWGYYGGGGISLILVILVILLLLKVI
jgi:uncharacterized protein DUF3309